MTQRPLLELVYASRPTELMSTEAVEDLLVHARTKNAENGVTGLLCYDHHQFLQIIEGDVDVILDLFHTIQSDPRHKTIRILHEGEIRQRAFDDWQMAYETMPSGLLPTLINAIDGHSIETTPGSSAGTRIFTLFMDELQKNEPESLTETTN